MLSEMGIRRPAALVALLVFATGAAGYVGPQSASAAESTRDATSPPVSTPVSTPAATRKPNIVFVLTDDLDMREVSTMPNVKALIARRGETFSNYFVSNSLCCPSRATTLRGQYAHDDGVESNGGGNGGFEAAHTKGIERSTVGTWLQAAGYRTALIGKYLNGYPNGASDRYEPPGWNDWITPSRPGNPYSEYNYTLNDNGRLVHHGHAPADYGTDVYVHAAKDFITGAAEQSRPFFLYLAPYAPHRPATPAPRDVGSYPGARAPHTAGYNEADVRDKPAWVRREPRLSPFVQRKIDGLYRRRIQSLRAVDDGVAGLVDTLRKSGQLANTYFVFTSDNGFHLGQHRLPAGKETAYEEDIHVPMFVRGPGVPAGAHVDALVGNVDLAPTFAALAGARVPDFVDGRSFAPFLSDPEQGPADWRHAYLLEHWLETPGGPSRSSDLPLEPPDPDQSGPGRSVSSPKHKRPRRHVQWLALNDIPNFRGLRTARYTYVEYDTGERELYDLSKDPAELRNLPPGAEPALRERLHRELLGLANCTGAGCRTAEAPNPD
jgi:N-acetylglucosamine-6-sulfatase